MLEAPSLSSSLATHCEYDGYSQSNGGRNTLWAIFNGHNNNPMCRYARGILLCNPLVVMAKPQIVKGVVDYAKGAGENVEAKI